MNWLDVGTERDSAGELTPLAVALKAIEVEGCDCEAYDDEPHTCIAGVCEAALKAEWERAEAAETKLAELQGVSGGGLSGVGDVWRIKRKWHNQKFDVEVITSRSDTMLECKYVTLTAVGYFQISEDELVKCGVRMKAGQLGAQPLKQRKLHDTERKEAPRRPRRTLR